MPSLGAQLQQATVSCMIESALFYFTFWDYFVHTICDNGVFSVNVCGLRAFSFRQIYTAKCNKHKKIHRESMSTEVGRSGSRIHLLIAHSATVNFDG